MRFLVSPDRLRAVWRHHLEIVPGWHDCTEMGDLEFLMFMVEGQPMSHTLAHALLDWYRINVCDDNPRSAWHTIHRNGPLALSACVTAQDFEIVASAMEVAAILVQQLPDWASNPPAGHTVEFNGQRAALWKDSALVTLEHMI